MDSVTCQLEVRNALRNYLADPYASAGGTSRGSTAFIFADEPVSAYKYPIIQVKKLDNPSIPISIGSDYWEQELVFLNIWFFSKNGFKITTDSKEYTNAMLVEYYLGRIKTVLKQQFNTLWNLGVKDMIVVSASNPEYDQETQLYMGYVTIRVRFFTSRSA